MKTFYIVHREDVGKLPQDHPRTVCATWSADSDEDTPTQTNLQHWCIRSNAAFPADLVDETGAVVLRDDRFP